MIDEEEVAEVFIFSDSADAVDGLVWKLEDILKIKSIILNNQGNSKPTYRDLKLLDSGIERYLLHCQSALGWSLVQAGIGRFAFESTTLTSELQSNW